MEIKTFTSTIFLEGNFAVKSISNREIIDETPLELAISYDNFGIDCLLIFDLSKNILEHGSALENIRKITEELSIPVIVAGNIKNQEDIDTLLSYGVTSVVLNFTKEANIELAQKIKGKYPVWNLMAAVTSANQIYENKELIEEITDGILLMKDVALHDCIGASALPMLVPVGDVSLDSLIKVLRKDNISGVFGSFVNANLKDINSIKILCYEKGINTSAFHPGLEWNQLKKNESNMIPVVVQDYKTNDVLMVAYMNQEAYELTCKTGRMTYYSRSRNELWIKGETSGHYQYVKSLYADCDSDTILAKIYQVGAACHTGSRSCFFKKIISKERY